MIIQAILDIFRVTIDFLLGILPNIPSFPEGILDSFEYITDLVVSVMGLLAYVLTPVILIFGLTSVLVLLNFDNVYKAVLWFLHKVRG